MKREETERLARERAEKMAMQEATANSLVVWFPLAFVAFVMMLGGAPSWLPILSFVFALVVGALAAMVAWSNAYKEYYAKCLAELDALQPK